MPRVAFKVTCATARDLQASDFLCIGLVSVNMCHSPAVRLQGQLCVLAEDCDQPDYKKLVEALCSEHNVSLLSVPEAKQLGQWAGVSPLGSCHTYV